MLKTANVNGVELHYVDQGKGAPIVFVHGGLADYREFGPITEALPNDYRTVRYSRRFSFPNTNPPPGPSHNLLLDVDDLAGLIEKLDLGPVHVVGASYGAFTALMLALRRPDLVRSVVAAEPPLLHWLPDIDGGREAHEHFDKVVLRPSAAAFAAGDPHGALRVAVEYFAGPDGMEQIPAEFRNMLIANLEDWRAITTANQIFPAVSRAEMGAMSRPVLMISGGNTAAVHRLVDPELERVLGNAERIVVEDGSHDMCSEQPAVCAKAIHDFIVRNAR
ncbi:MAG TPA: alpha/beta hydrolase [Sphingomicrobium sp.]|nr:alpha/beta hydrolase [Sphingomicrobium sp.]